MFKQYYAKIFDSRGEFLKNKNFSKYDTTFKFRNRRFNVNAQKGSFYEVTTIPFLLKKRYYFYNYDNPDPLILQKNVEPLINPELYNTIIENEEAKKLNNLHKKNLLNMIDPKIIIGVLIALGVGIYLLQGGSITG